MGAASDAGESSTHLRLRVEELERFKKGNEHLKGLSTEERKLLMDLCESADKNERDIKRNRSAHDQLARDVRSLKDLCADHSTLLNVNTENDMLSAATNSFPAN